MHGNLRDQNLQLILTILGESALAVEHMVHTTPPKVEKMDTTSAEAPTAQALVARSGSKVPDDAPIDDDSELLNFAITMS
jgi:hypothetical protein